MQIQKSADMRLSLRCQGLGFLDHQMRNAVDHWVGQGFFVTDQDLGDTVMAKRAMTIGAGQYLKQFGIQSRLLLVWSADP